MANWRLLTPRDWSSSGLGSKSAKSVWRVAHENGSRQAGILGTAAEFDASARILGEHVRRNRAFEHGRFGKLPRGHVPRAYRLASNGYVLSCLLLNHSQPYNLCEIGALIAADLPEFEYGSILRSALLFALTDAVKNGGSLAIQFRPSLADGGVPSAVVELARSEGLELEHAERGAISPATSRELFLRLSRFSPRTTERLRELHESGACSTERIGYLVHHGVWTREAVDAILNFASRPAAVLGDVAPPEARRFFDFALEHGRAALLGEILVRALRFRETPSHKERGVVFAFDDQPRGVAVDFDVPNDAWRIRPRREALDLDGWTLDGVSPTVSLGGTLLARMRPRSAAVCFHRLPEEIDAFAARPGTGLRAIVVADDIRLLSSEEQGALQQHANSRKVILAVCPWKQSMLDAEVLRRFSQARYVRK